MPNCRDCGTYDSELTIEGFCMPCQDFKDMADNPVIDLPCPECENELEHKGIFHDKNNQEIGSLYLCSNGNCISPNWHILNKNDEKLLEGYPC